MKRSLFLFALVAFLASRVLAAEPNVLSSADKSAGWKLLFDGHSLDDWKPSENQGTFTVKDGCIVAFGARSHLFYIGPVQNHDFKNFELQADIMTFPKANSGVYIHTEWQEKGWPAKGYEIQVNNSHKDPKRTAGVYAIKDNYEAVAKDEVWFAMRIKVEGKHIQTFVNDRLISDYTEEAKPERPEAMAGRLISHGTFALQGHDPESRVMYKNVKVRVLP